MLIERVFYPVETLGVGKRIVIWTCGCSKRCPKCISPEMWETDKKKDIPVQQLLKAVCKIIKENKVDGITISGGDPLEQSEEVLELISHLHKVCPDILIYTGFTLQELHTVLSNEDYKRLVENTAVLIDGRYIDELNDNKSPLTGSTNQNIHFFDVSLKPKYDEYCCLNERHIQNIFYGRNVISVGIHNKEEL